VTLFAAVSRFVRDKVAKAGTDQSRLRVHRNFAPATEPRNGAGEYFVVVGRLSPEKGVDTAIAAWRSPGSLLIVGDGPERARLAESATGGVYVGGAVEAEAVPAILKNARALLVPSRGSETAGRSAIEALAAGVPVLASNIGGLPEHVEDGVNGLLVPPGDVGAWRAAIDLLRDDDLSLELGAGAYRRWQEEFSPEVALESLLAIYREAIELHAAQRG
jgi:glycosyltransferase involved in cell wall biosynthesis